VGSFFLNHASPSPIHCYTAAAAPYSAVHGTKDESADTRRYRPSPPRHLTVSPQFVESTCRHSQLLRQHDVPHPTLLSSFPTIVGEQFTVRLPLRFSRYTMYQPFARLLQTSADTTILTQSLPEDGSTPFSVKLHEDSFRAYHTDTPSLEVEVTKDGLHRRYKEMECIAWSSPLMHCTRASSSLGAPPPTTSSPLAQGTGGPPSHTL
jgi:hypothetical protein